MYKLINIYYGTRIANFGDILAPFIGWRLFNHGIYTSINRKYVYTLYLIGSVLHDIDGPSLVWGAGCVNQQKGLGELSKKFDVKFLAVRGPNTREIALKTGHNCPELYLDTGVLAPYLFNISCNPIYEYGIILHFNDYERLDNELIENLKNDFHFISISDDPYLVLSEISKCKKILTSSLHGVIVSEAMGIPVCLLKTPIFNPFKVYDYYLGSYRTINDIKMCEIDKIKKTVDKSKIAFTKPGRFNISDFINASPYEIHDKNILEKMKQYYGDLMI